ncbi:MAG: transposase [Candidatus Thermoplasmatota archaeon]|nr:transposase [Candidatus Thermoplasmatota archaeon]
MKRETTQIFLKHFIADGDITIVDLTTVFSMSENVISATPGYDRNHEYLPEIRFTLLFNLKHMRPGYYRFVAGPIRDVSTIKITLKESGIRKAILIGDKGFYSEQNLIELEKAHINYIIPLRRNSGLIDYEPCRGDRNKFQGYFMFDSRPVWFHSSWNGRRIILFLDESLRLEEEKDVLLRKNGMDTFNEKQFILGTIAVITDLEKSEREVYELLKQRSKVEQAFDTFKNVLHADRTYMRDDYALEGWFLVNFVSLLLYYEIYNLLRENDLLSKYSPMDVLVHMSRIHKLKIKNKWVTSEIPKKVRVQCSKVHRNPRYEPKDPYIMSAL